MVNVFIICFCKYLLVARITIFARKFPGNFRRSIILSFIIFFKVQMSKVDQIELTNISHGSPLVQVDNDYSKVDRVSFRTLYFKYATKRDIWYLCLGLVCMGFVLILTLVALVSGILTPISFIFYGPILDELNSQDVDYPQLRILLFQSIIVMLVAAIFSFFERACLGCFAGIFASAW